jgi:hypothetical protein
VEVIYQNRTTRATISGSDTTRALKLSKRENKTMLIEKHLFKWKDIKKLKRKEIFHLLIESNITGWDAVEQQKEMHAQERAKSDYHRPLGICWECEDIFKKIKRKGA